MTISLNLSTSAIANEIYAVSALRCLTNGDESRPPILTRDQQPALLLLIKDAFEFMVMKIIDYVENCNLNNETATASQQQENKDMILSVDVRMGDNITASIAGAMRIALEHAIANYALHICYINKDDDTSNYYHEIARNEVASLRQLLSTASFRAINITPQY